MPVTIVVLGLAIALTVLGLLILTGLFVRVTRQEPIDVPDGEGREPPIVRRGHAAAAGCFVTAALLAAAVLVAPGRGPAGEPAPDAASGWWASLRGRIGGLESALGDLAEYARGLDGPWSRAAVQVAPKSRWASTTATAPAARRNADADAMQIAAASGDTTAPQAPAMSFDSAPSRAPARAPSTQAPATARDERPTSARADDSRASSSSSSSSHPPSARSDARRRPSDRPAADDVRRAVQRFATDPDVDRVTRVADRAAAVRPADDSTVPEPTVLSRESIALAPAPAPAPVAAPAAPKSRVRQLIDRFLGLDDPAKWNSASVTAGGGADAGRPNAALERLGLAGPGGGLVGGVDSAVSGGVGAVSGAAGGLGAVRR